jgi:hypothetical protein
MLATKLKTYAKIDMENAIYTNLASNVTATPSSSNLVLILVGVGLVIVAVVYVYRDTLFPPKTTPMASASPTAAPEAVKPAFTNETWCLVGEDLSGRYCVRVPSEHSCDPNRTFSSRTDCELTPAQALPSGIATEGSTKLTPLGMLSISS